MVVTRSHLSKLEAHRQQVRDACENMLLEARAQGRDQLNAGEAARFDHAKADLDSLDESIREYRGELERAGSNPFSSGGGIDAMTYGRQWAEQVAERLHRSMGGEQEQRVVVSGSLDIPQLVEPNIIAIARPVRLIDLFRTARHWRATLLNTSSRRCEPTPPPPYRTPEPNRPRR
ncbi:MAG: hypothetical protein WA285_02185 [Mycobacterium sp.]|uniref:hypothetical protein n=1 Tax=Mycobacterium sp. TaxID=1785 RepID=UPI003BB53361